MSEVETMRLPLLALRGLIVFPGMIINLDVGRDRSIKAVETAMATTKRILLDGQKIPGPLDFTGFPGTYLLFKLQTDSKQYKPKSLIFRGF